MRYLDFDLEIGPGVGRDYPVSVRSTTGQTHGTMRFPLGELELENALLKLEKALLQSGGTRRKALTEQEQSVQNFGKQLFEALLEGDLRSLYYESKREATHQGRGLRVRLHIRAAELAALPWEYLYDPRTPDYLCLSSKTPLVRYLDLAYPIEPLTVAPPLQILVMIASPEDQDVLDTTRERERMRKALEPLERCGLVRLTWLEGQTWRDLQRAMRGGPWHIFHFIGHGAFDRRADEGALALADDDGQTYLIHATQVGRLLANHDTLRLIILNSCEGAKGGQRDLFSSTAATLAQRGIPAVLAMHYEISDHAAIELTRSLYESLADGLPVDAALAEARTAMSLEVNNSLEWGTPVLYLRSQDGILFEMSGQPVSPSPEPKTAQPIQATAAPSGAPAPTSPSQPTPAQPRTAQVPLYPRTKITNVASHSFGVLFITPWKEKMIRNLVLAQDPLPVAKTLTYFTYEANQEIMEVAIVENLSNEQVLYDISQAREIGTGELRLPPRLPKGSPIEINFELSEQGRLTISAREPASGRVVETTIQTAEGMPEEL